MVLERLNTSSSVSDLRSDYSNLKQLNDRETQALDAIFIEKGKKEEVAKRHEKEVQEEKKRREKILSSMSGSIRNKYEKIKIESDKLQENLERSQAQIEEYRSKMEGMRKQIGLSSVKQEALNLLDQLHTAELKRDQLIEETKNVLTPAEEREKLLKQIKDNNQEITAMEKKINELRDTCESIQSELNEKVNSQEDNDEQDDTNQKEIAQKYRELRKREIVMDEFLSGFDSSRENENEQLYNTRKNIVNFLETISKGVSKMKSEGGSLKQASGSDVTMADLHKVEELDKKVRTELEKLREKRESMVDELKVFSDLEALKRRSEARKQQLVVEKQNLGRYRENIKYELQSLQAQFEAIQAQLYDNDTHNQVTCFGLFKLFVRGVAFMRISYIKPI